MKEKIIKLITENGSISIAEFMNHVLCDPEYGYYQKKQPFGADGDFITAPEISQIFGEIIGCYAAYKWLEADKKPMQIIELGAGNGSLLDDFLRATKAIPDFHDNLTIHIVEISNRLRQIQYDKLRKYGIKIIHYDDFNLIEQKYSFIIANEFFDALPIYQYLWHNSNWHERLIDIFDKKLTFSYKKHPKNGLKPILSQKKPPKEGDIYEVSLTALHIMDNIANFIAASSSSGLIIDYGYIKKSYGDTMQALKRHKYHDVLQHIGEADVTAHVDFDGLMQVLDKYAAINYEITTQRNFLLNFGIEERTEQLVKHLDRVGGEKLKNSTKRLISVDQMGELFKVLLIN